jgi:hypothetical protein
MDWGRLSNFIASAHAVSGVMLVVSSDFGASTGPVFNVMMLLSPLFRSRLCSIALLGMEQRCQ